MLKAILRDEHKTLPCAAYLEGEYGVSGLFLGVPVVLGRHGVEKIVEIHLTHKESIALKHSVDHIRQRTGALNKKRQQ